MVAREVDDMVAREVDEARRPLVRRRVGLRLPTPGASARGRRESPVRAAPS